MTMGWGVGVTDDRNHNRVKKAIKNLTTLMALRLKVIDFTFASIRIIHRTENDGSIHTFQTLLTTDHSATDNAREMRQW